MSSTQLIILASTFAALTVEARPVYSACLNQTKLFGLTDDESGLADAKLESDMSKI